MVSRSNPYFVGSPATYGSRGLTSFMPSRGGYDPLPSTLGQLVGGIIESSMYDRNTDPNVQAARLSKLKADQMQDSSTVMRQILPQVNDPTVPLGDIAANAMGYGHMPAEDVGKLMLTVNAMRGPQGRDMDTSLSDAALMELAAGHSGGATFPASTYKERKAPTAIIASNGQPQLVPAEDSYYEKPVLDKSKVEGTMLGDIAASLTPEQQRQAVGANPPQRTPYNYIRTDDKGNIIEQGSSTSPPTGPNVSVYTGQVQPGTVGGLTKPVQGGLQQQNIAMENLRKVVGLARGIAQKDPTLFGVTGEARRLGQEAVQQIQNLGLMVGNEQATDLDSAYRNAVTQMERQGIKIPGINGYDPNLSDIRKISTLLSYLGPAALASQSGRDVSDRDVSRWNQFVGDPGSLLSSQQQYLSGLDLMDKVTGLIGDTNAAALGPAGTHPAAPAPAPAAPKPPIPSPVKPPQEMSDEELLRHIQGR